MTCHDISIISSDSAKPWAITLPYPQDYSDVQLGRAFWFPSRNGFLFWETVFLLSLQSSSFDGHTICVHVSHWLHTIGDPGAVCVATLALLVLAAGSFPLSGAREDPRPWSYPDGGWLSHYLRQYGNVVLVPTLVYGQIQTHWIWLLGCKKQKFSWRSWVKKVSPFMS